MFEKQTLEDLLREEEQKRKSENLSYTEVTNKNYEYQPVYDNGGYCSRFD